MRARGRVRAPHAAFLLAATALALPRCIGSSAALECAIDADCSGGFCAAGFCHAGTRTCPLLQPTFSSINQNLLQVGCGVKQMNCHSAGSPSIASGPSFAGDVYRALVSAPAANLGIAQGLILVQPGDPQNSFLLAKLQLTEAANRLYGSGQPPETPGSICGAAQDVIAQWIAKGAQNH